MSQGRPPLARTRRLLSLAALLFASLFAGLVSAPAWADDYADVNQMLRAGRHAEALARADQYLAGKPRDPQMRFLKGVILGDTGRTTEAADLFTKLIEDYPELPEPYNNLAVIQASQSQWDKARANLEMALRVNPSYATAHENLGDVHLRLAMQSWRRAQQLDVTLGRSVAPKLAAARSLVETDKAAARPAVPAPAPAYSRPASR